MEKQPLYYPVAPLQRHDKPELLKEKAPSFKQMTGEEHARVLLREGFKVMKAKETLETMGYFVRINSINPPELHVSLATQRTVTNTNLEPPTKCVRWEIT
ncbi:MAG: hypothetical protein AAB552_00950 [Patescibacteria group bacterium]